MVLVYPSGMAPKRGKAARRLDARLEQKVRVDGWQNLLTGLGDPARDKRRNNRQFVADVLTFPDLEEIYRGDDMAARIIDTIPEEMTREGFEIHIEKDDQKERAEDLMARLGELDVLGALNQALKYKRAYGGAGILLGIDDGQKNLALPLNEDRVKAVNWLSVLSPRELIPMDWYSDPREPKYGKPSVYKIVREVSGTTGFLPPGAESMMKSVALKTSAASLDEIYVHETRLVLFFGKHVSRRVARQTNGWGDSVLQRCNTVIQDFQQSWDGVAVLMHDMSQAVLKIQGLAELIASNGKDVITDRLQMMNMARSVVGCLLVDADGEDFERKPTPMSGVDKALEQFCLRLAAAAEMPVSLLMGQSPAGLQATGDADIRFFYDRIKASQRIELEPIIKRLACLVMTEEGQEAPANWSVTFAPLWQMTDKEKADMRYVQAQADCLYITNQVLLPEEVAVSRFGGDTYSTETKVDFDLREEMKAEEEKAQAEGQDPNAQKPNDPNAQKPQPGAGKVELKIHLPAQGEDKGKK